MTRTLPWKRATEVLGDASGAGRSRSSLDLARHVKVKSESLESGPGGNVPTPKKRVKRSHSTSPPPEPLVERFMLEGLDADDRYRMVEDEFFSTAQRFTAHLHAAEYQRLKEASKSNNANAIKDISRPVVGSMTDLVRRKQERKDRARQQRLAIKRAKAEASSSGSEESGSDDDGTRREESLFGLMESPRKKIRRLDALLPVTKTTRAAAGYNGAKAPKSANTTYATAQPKFDKLPGIRSTQPKAKHTEPVVLDTSTDEDEDDLDAPAPKGTGKSARKPGTATSSSSSALKSAPRLPNFAAQSPVHPVRPASSTPQPKSTSREEKNAESSEDSDGAFFKIIQNRRKSHKTSRELRRQSGKSITTHD